MKYLVLLATIFIVAGCTKNPVCDVAKSAAGIVAAEIQKALDCQNLDAIKATLETQLEKIKVCSATTAKGPLGDVVCEPLVSGLLLAASGQIPAEWQCSGGPAKDQAKAKLLELCLKAL